MMLGLPDAVKRELRRRQRHQAPDLVGARAPGDQARDHGVLPQLAALRDVRLDRDGLGDAAASRRAAHQARLDRPRDDRHRRDQASRSRTATRCPTARSARSTRARLMRFDGYWKLPEKTAEAFRGDYCSVGDMARRDERGLLLSRRPQEQHDHQRRREHLPVRGRKRARAPIPRSRTSPSSASRTKVGRGGPRRRRAAGRRDGDGAEILDWCTDRIAGYKRPRSVAFIRETRCRAPPPARSFTACCGTAT